ncbi:hypothetical protein DER29_3914 [Micromonospora sp. M71_S20]|nr:hypothetical protein DER29_3914 [Micromonospora sp. M71_S20]
MRDDDMWRRAPVVCCLLLSLAACTSTREPAEDPRPPTRAAGTGSGVPAPTPGGPGEVACAYAIDTLPEPPAGYRIVLGDVAVPESPVLQVAESGDADPALRLFAKWGLLVRSGAVVDIQVAPGREGEARIGWGGAVAPAPSVRVNACGPGTGRPQWLAFAGGTWVARPACVPMVLRSAGRQAQVRMGVGAPCGGVDGP